MRKSKWYSFDVCRECEHRFKEGVVSEKMHSNGTCPYCGNNSGTTVCTSNKITLREIKHYKWWQIFHRKKTYEGRNEISKEWLKKH